MMRNLVVAAIAVFALAACASPKYVVSDVTRFHNLPSAPAGQTFVIATLDAEQGQSLAFRGYADAVTAKLAGMGLKPGTGSIENSDYVVTVSYSVRGPTPDIESRTSNWSFGAGYGGWGHHSGGFGSIGYSPDFDSYTDTRQIFVRQVELNIYRGATYNTPKRERVFEGRAISAGQNGQIEPVLPYIMDAMFKDFPGRSGETQRVSVRVPDEMGDRVTSGPKGRSTY